MKSLFKESQLEGGPSAVTLRRNYLKENPFCAVCLIKYGKETKATQVHHIIPATARIKIECYEIYLPVCGDCHLGEEGFHSISFKAKLIQEGLRYKIAYERKLILQKFNITI